jgi:hypothetical protein
MIWKIQKKLKSNSEKIGKYGENVSRIVKRFGKYGGKASRIVKRHDKYGRKVANRGNDMENMEEK